MSVTVRTLETPTPSEDDRRISWHDKPVLVDAEHSDGRSFTVDDGMLYVWHDTGTASKPLAVYSPGHWIFAKVNAETNAPIPA